MAVPLVLLVTAAGEGVVAALALRDGDSPSGRTVTPLASPWSEYAGPVGPRSRDDEVCAVLVQHLACAVDRRATVLIDEVPAGSAFAWRLLNSPNWRCVGGSTAGQVLLPGRWRDLPATGENGKRLRQARRGGELSYDAGALDPSVRATALAELMDLHAAQWSDRAAPDRSFSDPVVAAGCRNAVANAGAEEVYLARLRLDGRTIAGQLCFRRDDVYYSYRPAMDPDYRRLSPGHLLLLHLLADAARAGGRQFDLTRGDLPYKHSYADVWSRNLTFLRMT